MKVRINERKCQGFGMCVGASPDLFALGDSDGYAYLKGYVPTEKDAHLRVGQIPPLSEEAAMLAASVCPMQAIEIIHE